MLRQQILLLATLGQMLAVEVRAENAANVDTEAFQRGIVLIGCTSTTDPDRRLIKTVTPDGADVGTVIRLGNSPIISGRLSPDGKRIGYSDSNGLWLIDSQGRSQKILRTAAEPSRPPRGPPTVSGLRSTASRRAARTAIGKAW